MGQILSDWERMVLPFGLSLTLILGGAMGYLLGFSGLIRKNYWNVREVQQGYVIPNKLEIIVDDLDKRDCRDIPEVYLKYNGKSYALCLDKKGKPLIRDYEIKLVKVIPTEVILK